MNAAQRQFRAAQRQHESLSPPEHDERLDAIYDELCADPKAVAEADSWNDGMQSGEHYAAVEIALADLHSKDPSDLLGSDLLTNLYRLAKVHGEAREARLREAAEVAYQKEVDEANEARSESRMDRAA